MKFINNLKDQAKKLKSEIVAISIAFRDKRTPRIAKIIIGLTIGYALSPIDLIPDFIPVLGYIDDLIILPMLIAISIKLIPDNVLIESRQKAKENGLVNSKYGLFSAIVIVFIWIGLLGTVIFKLLKK